MLENTGIYARAIPRQSLPVLLRSFFHSANFECFAIVAITHTAMTGVVVIRDLVGFEVHQRVGDTRPFVSIESPNQSLHFILRSLSLTSEK